MTGQSYYYIVNGRRGIKASISVKFEPSFLYIKLEYSDDPRENKEFHSLKNFHHPLQRGLNIKKGAANTFRTIYNRIHKNLFKDVWEDSPTVDMAKELRGLHAFLVEMQDKFLETLDPEFVVLSRKFPSHRLHYYRFFKNYDHPHLRQMVVTCPGLISVLVLGIEKNLMKYSRMKQFKMLIIRGAKVRTILEYIFDYLLQDDYNDHTDFDLWRRAKNFSIHRSLEMKANWIWLVQNASALVSGSILLMPPPAFLPKSDMPDKARAKANWYRRIRSFAMMMIPETEPEITQGQLRGLILMASKADGKFLKYSSNKKSHVVRYLTESTRRPNGKTDYRKFFKEAAVNYQAHMNSISLEDVLKVAMESVKTTNEIHSCRWNYSDDEITIKPLVTWDDYQNESKLMVNCTRKLWYEAHLKKCVHFHVSHNEKDYTLEIKLPYVFFEAMKGFKNTDVPEELLGKVQRLIFSKRTEIQDHLKSVGYEIPEDEQLSFGTGKSNIVNNFISHLLQEPNCNMRPQVGGASGI